jgi:hypothetical protein
MTGVPRLSQDLLDAFTQRVQNEMGGTGVSSLPGIDVPEKEVLDPDLARRLKRQTELREKKEKALKRFKQYLDPEDPLLDPNIKLDIPTIKYRIRYAGSRRLLLLMTYNDQVRLVEPYSYRYRGKNGKILFYGYCRLHASIHSFYLDKITGLRMTTEMFAPRWPIEVG